MTIFVNQSEIKHTNVTSLVDNLEALSTRLTILAHILKTDNVLDIGMLDEQFLDVRCGDCSDQMYVITRKFSELLEPYQEQLLDQFNQEYNR